VTDDDAKKASDFQSWNRKKFLPLADAEALCRVLSNGIRELGFRPDLIVCIANGGLLPGQIVANQLNLPLEIVRVRRKGSRLKKRLVRIKDRLRIPTVLITRGPTATLLKLFERLFHRWWPTELEDASSKFGFDAQQKTVLLVDDCIVSGSSVRHVHGQLIAAGAREVKITAICVADDGPLTPSDPIFPVVYINRLVHFYPWSANHPQYDEYTKWLRNHGFAEWD
jgi:hypoxanthine phosphoribosyltransferase